MPAGVPPPGATGATLAEKVTVWPDTGLAGLELTVVVVWATLTVTEAGPEVAAVKLESPP